MNDKTIFQVPGYLTKIESKTHTWKIQFETMEDISGDALQRFKELKDKPSHITVSSHLIEATDIIDLPPLRPKDEEQKTKSQRLRATLFRMWEQNNEGFKTHEQHYDYHMERFINHVKSKLE